MSDSRFHLKVEFSIYGMDFKWSPSLNWSAYSGEIDERITEWFLECHDKAYAKHEESIRKDYEEQDRRDTEARELAELARLRDKYKDLS